MSDDNGHTLGGKYGIAGNDLAAWLLGRGHGELLALTTDELKLDPPRCPTCGRRDAMRYRGEYWLCIGQAPYAHKAAHVAIPTPLQDIPPYKGDLLAVTDKMVDVVYTKEPHEKCATWKYKVT